MVKSDDPLEKITTAQAIQIILDNYRSSEYCQAAQAKVQEISQHVSSLKNVNPFSKMWPVTVFMRLNIDKYWGDFEHGIFFNQPTCKLRLITLNLKNMLGVWQVD